MTQRVKAYRSAGQPIVHVFRLYDGDDVDLVRRAAIRNGARIVRPGSAGVRIAPYLLPDPEVELDSGALLGGELQEVGKDEVVMWKPRWSAFYRTSLNQYLRELAVDTVVVAGCNFPNCLTCHVLRRGRARLPSRRGAGRHVAGDAGPLGRRRAAGCLRHGDRGCAH